MFEWFKRKIQFDLVDEHLFGEFLKWKIQNEPLPQKTAWEKVIELRIEHGA